jgi:rod shape determining protein RodA
MIRKETWRYFDFWLFGAVVFLCVFGIAMISSAIAGNAVLADSVQRQAIFVAISLVLIVLVSVIDYRIWGALARPLYIFALVLLIGINIIGQAAFGSARWFTTALVNIQPSELAKVIIIIVLAKYFSSTKDTEKNLAWIFKGFLLTAGIVVWILLQPNLSTSIVVLVVWFAMMWISGLPTKYMIIFGSLTLIGIGIFIALVYNGVKIPFIEPYQITRILNFVFPNPNARHGDTYNVDQALITIGSGGLTGMGYGHGTQVQLRFLKVRHTDFIFSAMAEEFGFIGTILITALLVFVIIRCLRAARLAGDQFGALLAYGFAILLFFQAAVNIGVNLNLVPVTGLTLPFISYGGSSLLSLMLGIGFVESVVSRQKSIDF